MCIQFSTARKPLKYNKNKSKLNVRKKYSKIKQNSTLKDESKNIVVQISLKNNYE